MSHTFIELYTATPAWTTLPPEQRNAFFARIGAGMQQFDPARITPLAMGRIAGTYRIAAMNSSMRSGAARAARRSMRWWLALPLPAGMSTSPPPMR